jgi:hypothetical protein
LAIGLLFATFAYATDLGGLGSLLIVAGPAAKVIFLAGSAVTFAPIVVATAIGLVAWDS